MTGWRQHIRRTGRPLVGLFALLLLVLSGDFGTIPEEEWSASDPVAYERYAKIVDRLYLFEGDALKLRFYLYSLNFEYLSKNPHEKLPIALRYLKDDHGEGRKFFVILSMYRLSIDDRLFFLRELLSDFDSGAIDVNNLTWALEPAFGQGLRLDYLDERVIALLHDFRKRTQPGTFFDRQIDDLLSGQMLFMGMPRDTILKDWVYYLTVRGVRPTWTELYKALKIYILCKFDRCTGENATPTPSAP